MEENNESFYDLKAELMEVIYKNIEYDRKKLKLIVRVNPEIIKLQFLIKKDGLTNIHGTNIFPEKDKKLQYSDRKAILESIEYVIDKMNTIAKEVV